MRAAWRHVESLVAAAATEPPSPHLLSKLLSAKLALLRCGSTAALHAQRCSSTATTNPHGAEKTMSQAPVVIAGGGVSGLVMALELAKRGVKSIVLERGVELSRHPRAHYINNRTMEVFRSLAGLADEVSGLSPPLDEWRKFVYCRSIVGGANTLLGEVDHFKGQTGPRMESVSPEPVAHLPQSRLLPLLMRRAQSRKDEITLKMGLRISSFESSIAGVSVLATDSAGRKHSLLCDYLVAADGAHSDVRQMLGIRMEGEPALQHLINIHFFSKQLSKLASQLPAMLYFVFNADVVAVVVAHDIGKGEFVAQVPYFPPLQSLDDFPTRVCVALMRSAAGVPDLDVRVDQVKTWTMTAQVADRFQDSHHRVFLVGDAAHCFPPAGGFGMNTGIQDAHNLAWKLAAVHHAAAGRGLLTTYEMERRPVAVANTALSVSNWNEPIKVPSALGLSPQAATLLNSIAVSSCGLGGRHTGANGENTKLPSPPPQPIPPAASSPSSSAAAAAAAPSSAPSSAWPWSISSFPTVQVLSVPVAKAVLEGSLALGRSLSDASWGPLKPLIKARVQQIFNSGGTLRLQFPREDLGFKYTAGALHPRERPFEPLPGKKVLDSKRDATYVPSSAPGCRLPHFWLLDTAVGHASVEAASSVKGIAAHAPHSPSVCQATPMTSNPPSTINPSLTAPTAPVEADPNRIDRSQPGIPTTDLSTPVSTIDLAASLDCGLLLLSDWKDGEANVWAQAGIILSHGSHRLGQLAPLPHGALSVVQVMQQRVLKMPDPESDPGAPAGGGPWRRLVDVGGSWPEVMGLPLGSAILVRPDGHVAANLLPSGVALTHAGALDDAMQRLGDAVRDVLYIKE